MAGILNSKERVMDFIVTQEGKRQAGFGQLRTKFASFTDLHTFYEKSGSLDQPDLADDASSRIFFEAHNRYQDVIVPELEEGTSLRPFKTGDFEVAGNIIASGTFQVGFINRMNVLTGSDLPQMMPEVLNGITQNFSDQRIIGSIDEYSFSQDFKVQPAQVEFKIDKNFDYLRTTEIGQDAGFLKLESAPSIFHDARFSHFPNFLYLPPENAPEPGFGSGTPLGVYPHLAEEPIASLDDILNSLKDKQNATLRFDPTSRGNNIVCQFFEASGLGVDKLSVIDFGNFDDEIPGSPESILSPGRRVFFVGKMRRDSSGAETFVCIFTVIID